MIHVCGVGTDDVVNTNKSDFVKFITNMFHSDFVLLNYF